MESGAADTIPGETSVAELRQHKRGCRCDPMSFCAVLTNMASTMAACRKWIDRCGQRLDTKTCKAFNIGVADPFLENGTDSEGSTAYR